MGIYLNPRADGFEQSVRSPIYIDKTELLAYTNEILNTEQRYCCISRPRRFGKSITAKMLAAYYCQSCDTKELFDKLKISKKDSYETHLNQYDVIFLNMQDLLSQVGETSQFTAYLQGEVLYDLNEIYGVYMRENEQSLVRALKTIHSKSGKGFVFIIDEWDCLLREAPDDKEIQKKYLDFLRNLLKDQAYVKLAYMTGILPIKKYGTHSALNMFTEFSMTEPKQMASYIGFTEEEVRALCEMYRMDFDETKRWYDGYRMAKNLHVYNPKSVVDAMLNQEFHSYWSNTETYEALKIYIDMNFEGLKDDIIFMLSGGSCPINPRTFTNDMTTFHSKDDVLTLLVHLGYLTYDTETKEARIPNEEVRGEFYNAISYSGWNEVMDAIHASKELLEKTWAMDSGAVAKGIDAVHVENTSILSYHNENSLGCVISLAYYSARSEYTMLREFPTGKGFADIVFLPHKYSVRPAMVVELKWDQSAKGAIKQIKDKNYIQALEQYTGEILLVGVNYDKESKIHQCVIEKYRK